MSAQAFASVLGVYAHPDDADVDAGATIARLARQGARVTLVQAHVAPDLLNTLPAEVSVVAAGTASDMLRAALVTLGGSRG